MNEKWIKTEIKKEIKIVLELNEIYTATYTNLQDTVKAVFRSKFIVTKTGEMLY